MAPPETDPEPTDADGEATEAPPIGLDQIPIGLLWDHLTPIGQSEVRAAVNSLRAVNAEQALLQERARGDALEAELEAMRTPNRAARRAEAAAAKKAAAVKKAAGAKKAAARKAAAAKKAT